MVGSDSGWETSRPKLTWVLSSWCWHSFHSPVSVPGARMLYRRGSHGCRGAGSLSLLSSLPCMLCLLMLLQLDMGLNPYAVDKVIAGKFGMPMGPFRYGGLFAVISGA